MTQLLKYKGTLIYSASARSLRRRSALMAESARPTHATWSVYYGVDVRTKYKMARLRKYAGVKLVHACRVCVLRRTKYKPGLTQEYKSIRVLVTQLVR